MELFNEYIMFIIAQKYQRLIDHVEDKYVGMRRKEGWKCKTLFVIWFHIFLYEASKLVV